MSMRFVLERVIEPESEPVTLAEMKRHLREFDSVTANDDDITNLIVAAREWVEDYTGRALMDQSWRLTVQNHAASISGDDVGGYSYPARLGYYSSVFRWTPTGEILLRKSPALAITSFVTVDNAGAETAVDAATYELREADSKWPRVFPLNGAAWGTNVFRIVFRAGYADTTGSPQQTAAEVPERYKIAMKLWVEAMYDRDPAMMDKLLDAAKAMIKMERVDLGFA